MSGPGRPSRTEPAEATETVEVSAAEAPEERPQDAAAPEPEDAGSPEGAPPDENAPPDAEAEALEGDIAELQSKAAERDEYLALAQRAQADFENYRKRAARDVAAAELRGVSKLAKALLGALDNLDRAIEHLGPGEADSDSAYALKLARDELHTALGSVGVEPYSPAGEPFDPELHEAMAKRRVDGAEPGTVAEVYQRGYRHEGGVLRPARVVVAE